MTSILLTFSLAQYLAASDTVEDTKRLSCSASIGQNFFRLKAITFLSSVAGAPCHASVECIEMGVVSRPWHRSSLFNFVSAVIAAMYH